MVDVIITFTFSVLALQKLTNQVTILNSNKARNLLIARKRINLPENELQTVLDKLDIVQLPPECAELLVKFTPTPEEVSTGFTLHLTFSNWTSNISVIRTETMVLSAWTLLQKTLRSSNTTLIRRNFFRPCKALTIE